MPINSNFLSDLSSGIFGRMGELRNEQTGRDEKRRGETLSLLAGLADKVEPESLPLLMQHLGDTMKLQGPMKKFWQAFSGMPDRGLEDQLGTKLQGILGSTVGPETAKKARTGGDLARLSQPTNPQQETNRSARLLEEGALSNKLVFRDPRQEKLDEIERRYEGQTILQNDRLNLQNQYLQRRQEDTQAHQREMVDLRSEAKAQSDIDERAWMLAVEKGFGRPNKAIRALAASQLAKEQGWSNEKTQAQIRLLGSRAEESEATAQSLRATGGLKPTDVDRRQKNFLTAQENLAKSEGAFKGIQENQSRLLNQINTTANTYPGYTFKFDPAKGKLVVEKAPPKANQAQIDALLGMASGDTAGLINDYRKLEDQSKEETGKAEGFRKSMDEYRKTRPKAPVKPQGPSRPGPQGGFKTSKGIERREVPDTSTYQVDQIIRDKQTGKQYRVMGFEGPTTLWLVPVK